MVQITFQQTLPAMSTTACTDSVSAAAAPAPCSALGAAGGPVTHLHSTPQADVFLINSRPDQSQGQLAAALDAAIAAGAIGGYLLVDRLLPLMLEGRLDDPSIRRGAIAVQPRDPGGAGAGQPQGRCAPAVSAA